MITSPSVGGTVTDGTVTWTINKNFPVSGGTLTGNTINRDVNTDRLSIFSGGSWNDGAQLSLFGRNNDASNAGCFELMAIDVNQRNPTYLRGASTYLRWDNNDLGGSAIVAKSLSYEGYIKYASGLIIQWGYAKKNSTLIIPANSTAGKYDANVTFPISFTSTAYKVAVTPNAAAPCYAVALSFSTSSCEISTFLQETTLVGIDVRYIAIGY